LLDWVFFGHLFLFSHLLTKHSSRARNCASGESVTSSKHSSWIVPGLILWLAGAVLSTAQAQTLQELFNQFGAGTRALEKSHGAYWSPHIQRSRRAILEAIEAAPQRRSALVLGAGQCREIPLQELARQFQRIVLADLDHDSMAEAVKTLPQELRAKVEIRVTDVTSFATRMMLQMKQAVRESESASEAYQAIRRIYASLPEAERQTPDLPKVDFLISSLVLSELHHYPRYYADKLIQDKFGFRAQSRVELDQVQEQLRRFAISDHVALLSGLSNAGAFVYFADTIARGPIYANIVRSQKQRVLVELLPDLARLGFFQAIQDHVFARETFLATFGVMRAQYDPSPLKPEQMAVLLKRLSASEKPENVADSAAASEAALQTMGRGLLPTTSEIEVLERLIEGYHLNANAMESLLSIDVLETEWSRYGLAQAGRTAEWWWLAYPYAIPQNWGAFRVRHWTLRKNP